MLTVDESTTSTVLHSRALWVTAGEGCTAAWYLSASPAQPWDEPSDSLLAEYTFALTEPPALGIATSVGAWEEPESASEFEFSPHLMFGAHRYVGFTATIERWDEDGYALTLSGGERCPVEGDGSCTPFESGRLDIVFADPAEAAYDACAPGGLGERSPVVDEAALCVGIDGPGDTDLTMDVCE